MSFPTSWFTSDIGVASKTLWTATYRIMIDHVTEGIRAASSDARICTLLSVAGLIKRALAVGYTLWAAIGRAIDVTGLA